MLDSWEKTKEACAVLNIPWERRNDESLVRKQYHRMALKYHPDKNRLHVSEAAARFVMVQDAYEILAASFDDGAATSKNQKEKNDMTEENEEEDERAEEQEQEQNKNQRNRKYARRYSRGEKSFFEELLEFLNTLYNNEQFQKQVFHPVLLRILSKAEHNAIPYLRRLPLPKLKVVYQVLAQYQDAFHLSKEFLDSVRQMIAEHSAVVNTSLSPLSPLSPPSFSANHHAPTSSLSGGVVEAAKPMDKLVLRPSLEDMFEHRVFVIERDQEKYYVPSWHEELYFDYVSRPFVAQCIPQLPPNYRIDEDNHLHITLPITLQDLWQRQIHNQPLVVTFYHGDDDQSHTSTTPTTPPFSPTTKIANTKNKKHADTEFPSNQVCIDISSLLMKTYQVVVFAHRGLPVSCQDSILSTLQKAHIFIHLWIQAPTAWNSLSPSSREPPESVECTDDGDNADIDDFDPTLTSSSMAAMTISESEEEEEYPEDSEDPTSLFLQSDSSSYSSLLPPPPFLPSFAPLPVPSDASE